jgi:hypothetical protein
MIITSLTIIQPWEKDMVTECRKEYQELLITTKGLADDYNKVMELLRDLYQNGK